MNQNFNQLKKTFIKQLASKKHNKKDSFCILFMLQKLGLNFNSDYNSASFVLLSAFNDIKNSDDFVAFNQLVNLIYQYSNNTKENLKLIKDFKNNYECYSDDNGNDYFKNITTNKYEFIIKDSDVYNINNIKYKLEKHPNYSYFIHNDNLYFLNENINQYNDTRDDYILELNNKKFIYRKVHKIKDLEYKIKGKDWVKYYLTEPGHEGQLYFLTLKYNNNMFYKVGITKHNVNERYKNLNKEITIIDYKVYNMQMLKASIIERYYHDNYRHQKETLNLDFEGKHECYFNNLHELFNVNLIDNSIKYIAKKLHLNETILNLIIKEKENHES